MTKRKRSAEQTVYERTLKRRAARIRRKKRQAMIASEPESPKFPDPWAAERSADGWRRSGKGWR